MLKGPRVHCDRRRRLSVPLSVNERRGTGTLFHGDGRATLLGTSIHDRIVILVMPGTLLPLRSRASASHMDQASRNSPLSH